MTIYYTAKDIEELSAKGVQKLEIGPGVTLTDVARETAQQLDITLVEGGEQVSPATQPPPPQNSPVTSDKYNKPSGCQHGHPLPPNAQPQATVLTSQVGGNADSSTVNRLIDLMGKAIKRGG